MGPFRTRRRSKEPSETKMRVKDIAEEPPIPGEDVETEAEDLFEMANLYPDTTGLPMTVWISPRGNARHDAREGQHDPRQSDDYREHNPRRCSPDPPRDYRSVVPGRCAGRVSVGYPEH